MNAPSVEDLNRRLSPKYEVLCELGRGGMAVVYQARNLTLNRVEALKVLPESFVQDEDFVRRFLHEARTAAQLTYPTHIVTIHDAGQMDGITYFTMEYLEGETLAHRLKRSGKLPVDEAVHVALEVCRALTYAHGRGVTHRDIKPENIMLCSDGRVVVMDFGIARAARGTQMRTQAGVSIGTPHYMSPEQARGQSVDGRSDLYSLGIVLYYMAVGRAPFDAEDTSAVLYQQVHEPPAEPRSVNEQVPEWLNGVILKALAKNPGERFQGAEALERALRDRVAPVPIEMPEAGQSGGEGSVVGQQTQKIPLSPPPPEPPQEDEESPLPPLPVRKRPVGLMVGVVAGILALAGIGLIWQQVEQRKDDLAYRQAQRDNSEEAYEKYLEDWPRGRHVSEAQRCVKTRKAGEAAEERLVYDRLDPIVVNTADPGRTHYIQLQVHFLTAQIENFEQEEIIRLLESRKGRMLDTIIRLTTAMTVEELNTQEGKDKLKKEIRKQINLLLNDDYEIVEEVYFTAFTTQ